MYWWLALGIATGMRAMTPIAVFCVMAALGRFPALHHTWADWTTHWVSAVIFTVLALGEYIGDLLPQTPSRREYFPAAARIVFGALTGALAATAMTLPPYGGALFGAIGAVIGTTGFWWLRTTLARRIHRDWPVGVAESLLALILAVGMCSRLQIDATFWNDVEQNVTGSNAHPSTPGSPTPHAESPHSH